MSKSICLVTPSMKKGGMERVLSILANHLVSKGFIVYVICLISSETAYQLDDRIKIIAPKKRYRGGIAGKILTFFFLYKNLKKIAPDTCLSFSEIFNPLAVVAARIATCKCYISNRSSPNRTYSFFNRVVARVIYPFADGLIVQTAIAKKTAQGRRLNKNIAIIPNPLKEFRKNNTKTKKNIIVSTGRLIESKNFDRLINIFSKSDDKKDWQLVILGDGPKRSELQDQIIRMNLHERVKLPGSVDDIDQYLFESKIFAFTSTSEGFPNSLSEALGAPLPVIAYDCIAGPSDMIEHGGNGFLIKLGDDVSFAKKLRLLMETSSLRSRFTSEHETYRKKYERDRVCEMYLEFILRCNIGHYRHPFF